VIVDHGQAAARPPRRGRGRLVPRLRFGLRLASIILLLVPVFAGAEAFLFWNAAYDRASVRGDAAHPVMISRGGKARYITAQEKRAMDAKADQTYVIIGATIFAAVMINFGLGLRK